MNNQVYSETGTLVQHYVQLRVQGQAWVVYSQVIDEAKAQLREMHRETD